MSEKDLKGLNREELIAMIHRLNSNAIQMEKENMELRAKLEDRSIRLEKAGSIAEASLALNGVFEKAQNAADAYIRSAEEMKADAETWAKQRKEEADREAKEIVEQARHASEMLSVKTKEKAREYLSKTVTGSRKMVAEAQLELKTTKAECAALKAKTDRDIKEQWVSLEEKVSEIMKRCGDMKLLLESAEDLSRTLHEMNKNA